MSHQPSCMLHRCLFTSTCNQRVLLAHLTPAQLRAQRRQLLPPVCLLPAKLPCHEYVFSQMPIQRACNKYFLQYLFRLPPPSCDLPRRPTRPVAHMP